MINLELLEACKSCPDFDPVSERVCNIVSITEVNYIHTVTCKDIGKCRALLKQLQKGVKNNGN